MAVTLLVTGGTRSGKSNFAEERARDFGQHLGKRLVYIATEEAFDEDPIPYSHLYTRVRIKWQSNEPMRVLDIIVISKALDLNSLSRYYILEKIHTCKAEVSFEFT